jgi:hypothetical protein
MLSLFAILSCDTKSHSYLNFSLVNIHLFIFSIMKNITYVRSVINIFLNMFIINVSVKRISFLAMDHLSALGKVPNDMFIH